MYMLYTLIGGQISNTFFESGGKCPPLLIIRGADRRLSAIMFYLHFSNFLSIIYHWNQNEVFYLLSSSDVAYLDCVGIYKAFNFAASPKIECLNVLSPF